MSSLVTTLGMVAGFVWVSAAVWFQLIRPGRVHPKYVLGTFLVGSALMMTSSSTIVSDPTLVEATAITANVLFIVLGVGTWVYIEVVAEDAPTADELEHGIQY